MIDNKSYCPIPFKEIYVANSGKYKLCCHAQEGDVSESDALPFDYFFSEAIEDVRDRMMSGEEVKDCLKCTHHEKKGGYSYRMKAIAKWGYTSEVRDVSLKLRINGSACNLQCYMCHPYNSSSRRKELREIWGDDYDLHFSDPKKIKFTSKATSQKRNIWNDTIDNINEYIHLIKEIHMTGGEPLQLPRHWEWVDRIPDEHAKNITLVYDSNITQLNYKNQNVLDLKEKFKNVHFGISCDHIGEKLEYIRYPINHKEFEENLKFMTSHFDTSINVTVGLLNIPDLLEIKEYYEDIIKDSKYNKEVCCSSVVSGPRILSIRNLPEHLKTHYIQKYKQFPLVVSELKLPKHTDDWYKHMSEYMDKLYESRGLKWREVFDAESYRS